MHFVSEGLSAIALGKNIHYKNHVKSEMNIILLRQTSDQIASTKSWSTGKKLNKIRDETGSIGICKKMTGVTTTKFVP